MSKGNKGVIVEVPEDITMAEGNQGTPKKKYKEKRWNPTPEAVKMMGVKDGGIAIIGRPEHIQTLRNAQEAGVSRVVTLLREPEGAKVIGEVVKELGMEWSHFPIEYFGTMQLQGVDRAKAAVSLVKEEVGAGSRVLIHCFEGVHRSGLITLGAMLGLGIEPIDALYKLYKMRSISYQRLPLDVVMLAYELNGKTFKWEEGV